MPPFTPPSDQPTERLLTTRHTRNDSHLDPEMRGAQKTGKMISTCSKPLCSQCKARHDVWQRPERALARTGMCIHGQPSVRRIGKEVLNKFPMWSSYEVTINVHVSLSRQDGADVCLVLSTHVKQKSLFCPAPVPLSSSCTCIGHVGHHLFNFPSLLNTTTKIATLPRQQLPRTDHQWN